MISFEHLENEKMKLLDEITEKLLELRKRKDEQLGTENLFLMNKLWKRKFNRLEKED